MAEQRNTRFAQNFSQLEELNNNKNRKTIILDDNNSLAVLIETLAFLESFEANIVPVVFEAPERCAIDKRLKDAEMPQQRISTMQQTQFMTELGSCSVCIKCVLR